MDVADEAMAAAPGHGVTVSCDSNYRPIRWGTARAVGTALLRQERQA
ncbi:hypothetical protein ABZ614_07690 [Streptomyces sp. NPDC013178]